MWEKVEDEDGSRSMLEEKIEHKEVAIGDIIVEKSKWNVEENATKPDKDESNLEEKIASREEEEVEVIEGFDKNVWDKLKFVKKALEISENDEDNDMVVDVKEPYFNKEELEIPKLKPSF